MITSASRATTAQRKLCTKAIVPARIHLFLIVAQTIKTINAETITAMETGTTAEQVVGVTCHLPY